MENIAENDVIQFHQNDGILYSQFKGRIHLDELVVKKIIDLRHEVSNNTKQYWCMDSSGIKSVDKEARDYTDKYGQEFLFACAVLVNSHLAKFTFNAFLRLKNPHVPMQIFTDKAKAVKWLQGIRDKNNGN